MGINTRINIRQTSNKQYPNNGTTSSEKQALKQQINQESQGKKNTHAHKMLTGQAVVYKDRPNPIAF